MLSLHFSWFNSSRHFYFSPFLLFFELKEGLVCLSLSLLSFLHQVFISSIPRFLSFFTFIYPSTHFYISSFALIFKSWRGFIFYSFFYYFFNIFSFFFCLIPSILFLLFFFIRHFSFTIFPTRALILSASAILFLFSPRLLILIRSLLPRLRYASLTN